MIFLKTFFTLFLATVFIILFPKTANADYNFDDWSEDIIPDQETMGTIYMSAEKLNEDFLKLCAYSKEITQPTLGIAFHLNYQKDNLAFINYLPGTFLERGGDPFYLVNETEKGTIVFGETLRHNNNFPTGKGQIACFNFQILNSEQFKFEFTNGVISTMDLVRQDLEKIVWQDLLFDMELGNQIIDKNSILDYTQNSMVKQENGNKYTLIIAISMGFLGLAIGAIFTLTMLKKRSKKSVNFK